MRPSSAARSSSQQLNELINSHAGVGNDAAESAGADLLVIGNDGAGERLIAAQDDMTASLATEDEAGSLQGGADFAAGKIGWKLGHVRFRCYAASTSTNSLPASVGTGSPLSRQSSI
jgi:hypothetical protein